LTKSASVRTMKKAALEQELQELEHFLRSGKYKLRQAQEIHERIRDVKNELTHRKSGANRPAHIVPGGGTGLKR